MDKCWFVLKQTHYPPPEESFENSAFKQFGPLCLGHCIKDLKHLDNVINTSGPEPFPLDMPVCRTTPMEFEWESNEGGGGDVSAGAKVPVAAAFGVNAEASLGFVLKKTVHNYWKIEQLDAVIVQPTRAYVKRCIASEPIVEFLEDHKIGPSWSIFMITGLMIARGKSVQKASHGREKKISGGPGVGVLGNAEITGAGGGISSEVSTSRSTKYTNDFVWAVRFSKITKGFFDMKWSQKTYSKGATFDMKKSKQDIKGILTDEGLKDDEIWAVKAYEVENIVVSADAKPK